MKEPRERDGKVQAVTAAIREHRAALHAFVRRRVPSQDVEDVLQIAALKALEGTGSLVDPSRVVPWLYRVHRNVATDLTRHRASQTRLTDRVRRAEAALHLRSPAPDLDTTCRCSLSLAKTMNDRYATILAMVDLGEVTIRDAAQSLGITTNNATVRLHRARRALRRKMLEHCGVSSMQECSNCACTELGCCDDA